MIEAVTGGISKVPVVGETSDCRPSDEPERTEPRWGIRQSSPVQSVVPDGVAPEAEAKLIKVSARRAQTNRKAIEDLGPMFALLC